MCADMCADMCVQTCVQTYVCIHVCRHVCRHVPMTVMDTAGMVQGRCCTSALALLVVWTVFHMADAKVLKLPHRPQAPRSQSSVHDSSHLRRQSLKTTGTSTDFVLPATQCSAPKNASDLISVGMLQVNEDVGNYEFKQVPLAALGLGCSCEPDFAGSR